MITGAPNDERGEAFYYSQLFDATLLPVLAPTRRLSWSYHSSSSLNLLEDSFFCFFGGKTVMTLEKVVVGDFTAADIKMLHNFTMTVKREPGSNWYMTLYFF